MSFVYTPYGLATVLGANRYHIIEGDNLGKIYIEQYNSDDGLYYYIYEKTVCPYSYHQFGSGVEPKCVKNNGDSMKIYASNGIAINVTPTNGKYPDSVGSSGGPIYLVSGTAIGGATQLYDSVKGKSYYYFGSLDTIPNGNGTTETNWLLYGAIALGAFLLLRN
jgi:hypothetical protein